MIRDTFDKPTTLEEALDDIRLLHERQGRKLDSLSVESQELALADSRVISDLEDENKRLQERIKRQADAYLDLESKCVDQEDALIACQAGYKRLTKEVDRLEDENKRLTDEFVQDHPKDVQV